MPNTLENAVSLKNGKILVDLEALRRISHTCVMCNDKNSCCRSYEVEVTYREVLKVDAIMDRVSSYNKKLKQNGEYRDCFTDAEDAVMVIEQEPDGSCPFLRKRNGGCSIHAAAIDLGMDPYKTKPRLCTAWPLAIVPMGRGKTLISIDQTAYRFPCVKKKRSKSIAPDLLEAIGKLFGEDVADSIRERNSAK